MSHDPSAVANEFIIQAIDAERPVPPLQVQKLVFFAHAWMLGLYGGPLLNEELVAWPYGPVTPVIYHDLSYYGGDPATAPILAHDTSYTDVEENLIQQVWDKYGHLTGTKMSALTHVRGGPWDQVWGKRKRVDIIPDRLIRRYYESIAKQNG